MVSVAVLAQCFASAYFPEEENTETYIKLSTAFTFLSVWDKNWNKVLKPDSRFKDLPVQMSVAG